MQISHLIKDIQAQVTKKGDWFSLTLAEQFGREVGLRLHEQFGERKGPPTLRLSQMGPRCPRALWYSIHHPEMAEKMPPWAEVKFAYGHILEALAITLAKAAGHEVTGEQDAVEVDGVVGHRDCVIDGCIVDVKSASSLSFAKFKDGSIRDNDPFGYLDQLDGYLVGSLSDPLVRVKDKAYLLAIDKTLGHMCLYEHKLREEHIRNRIRTYKEIVARKEPPACGCSTVPDGKSGNMRLDTRASYNIFKYCCFPNLRTFLYANGPVYLTKVVRKPDVSEVDKNGNFVYN
jgi:hypothetical protein